MLYLNATFDTVYHTIIIDCRQLSFEIQGLALSWIKSFNFDEAQSVLLVVSYQCHQCVLSSLSSSCSTMLTYSSSLVITALPQINIMMTHKYITTQQPSYVLLMLHTVSYIDQLDKWIIFSWLKLKTIRQILMHQKLKKVNCQLIQLCDFDVPLSRTFPSNY